MEAIYHKQEFNLSIFVIIKLAVEVELFMLLFGD